MPYDLSVDHDLRLVTATVRGDVTEADLFAYNDDPIWSSGTVAGYGEMIDVTETTGFDYPIAASLPHFADSSARRDPPRELAGPLLIVAADDYFFGLARMYQSLRELHPLTQRRVGAFRTREEALAWLAAVRVAEAPAAGECARGEPLTRVCLPEAPIEEGCA
jgi:hypothetical protein